MVFRNTSLISITIPDTITSIGDYAFYDCKILASITFKGTIPSSSFGNYNTFPGDLRTKFYAIDKADGTPGTYTRTSGSTSWTKQ
jgi:hypothetical protein